MKDVNTHNRFINLLSIFKSEQYFKEEKVQKDNVKTLNKITIIKNYFIFNLFQRSISSFVFFYSPHLSVETLTLFFWQVRTFITALFLLY